MKGGNPGIKQTQLFTAQPTELQTSTFFSKCLFLYVLDFADIQQLNRALFNQYDSPKGLTTNLWKCSIVGNIYLFSLLFHILQNKNQISLKKIFLCTPEY